MKKPSVGCLGRKALKLWAEASGILSHEVSHRAPEEISVQKHRPTPDVLSHPKGCGTRDTSGRSDGKSVPGTPKGQTGQQGQNTLVSALERDVSSTFRAVEEGL